ncbi:MAG: outer membrane beta-barrel protein [Opitutales bacterium]|nr:outer membrane beta-barrel protein [Opitutales bacterium]MCH8541286.1 porin family protein [Opitutales bacterium]
MKLKTSRTASLPLLSALSALCFLAETSSAQAQTFGVRYADLGGFYARTHGGGDTFDTYGGNFQLNVPLIEENTELGPFGLDLRNQYSNTFDNESGVSLEGHRVAAGPLLYFPLQENLRPFATALLGHSFSRFRSAGGPTEKDNTWTYAAGIGFEWLPIERLSIAPRIAYSNSFSGGRDSMQYGAETDYWINDQFSLGVGYNYFSTSDDFTHDLVLRTRIRF